MSFADGVFVFDEGEQACPSNNPVLECSGFGSCDCSVSNASRLH